MIIFILFLLFIIFISLVLFVFCDVLYDLCKLNGLDFDKYTIKSSIFRLFKSRKDNK